MSVGIVAYGLRNKAKALSEFHHLDEAKLTYDERIACYGDDHDPCVEHLVSNARIAGEHLDRWWWRLVHGASKH